MKRTSKLLTKCDFARLRHQDNLIHSASWFGEAPSFDHRNAGFLHGNNDKISPFIIFGIISFASACLYFLFISWPTLLGSFVPYPPHLHLKPEGYGLLWNWIEGVLRLDRLFQVILHPVHCLRRMTTGSSAFIYKVVVLNPVLQGLSHPAFTKKPGIPGKPAAGLRAW